MTMIELLPDGVFFVRSFLAVTIGILVLFLGKAINQRVGALRHYNIPEPVTGGLLVAAALWLLYLTTGYRVTFELNVRDALLVYFFITTGIDAHLSDLRAGGVPLVILAICVTVFTVLQNVVGMGVATGIGQPAGLGVLTGSVALLGGPGTAIAWAPTFAAQSGIMNAGEIGVICATAGLVLASIAGGPVAHFLIRRRGLEGRTDDVPQVSIDYRKPRPSIDYMSFLRALLAIHLCGIAGILVHGWLANAGVTVPLFLPCLVAGLVFTNIQPHLAPRLDWPSDSPALALIAELALGVFLAMSLMSMDLQVLAELGGPVLALLVAQLALAVVFAVLVVFPALKRTYDAAVICAGFIGFGLGGNANAMANMTAITQQHGASRVAFLVVPLVGAIFASLLNAVVVRFFVALL